MSIYKYQSEVKYTDQNQEIVFNYLSDFDHFSQYVNEGLLSKVNGLIPQIKISDFESDRDSCRFKVSGMGQSEIRIIEREPNQTIKINSSGGLPVEITLWIQLLPVSPYKTKMKLTLHAEMSPMIKVMINKKLEDGINQLAEMLTQLPYR